MPNEDGPGEPLLSIRGLCKNFSQGAAALDNVNLQLERGRTLGLVGPSGSGKSTLARCVTFFEKPTAGEILFEGRALWSLGNRERLRTRARIQLIFQEPAASLNPRFTAAEIIAEPLAIQNRGNRATRLERACRLMETVGLPPGAAAKPAPQFSGGERQRLAIARALALDPKLLILDESFSGLDLTLQAQITALLKDLRQRLGVTYILISHDLALVAGLADEIAVMDHGRIVEHADTAQLLAHPQHPRTRELIDAAMALELP
ncbi:MAG TPA: dipeptide/oligopeptide/nickel ABC transporter ATP-binding protein [Candidatus Solibacter sp.]|nr:dipeptide/oligopeptide/nickel ABC transporter ATP-binding protein [Candidatus Solibacter sp.]